MYERSPGYGETDIDFMTERPMDLMPLKKLDGWKFHKDATDIRGWKLVDRDDNEIGKVDDILMSTSLGEAVFAIVDLSGLKDIDKKNVLIPLDHLMINKDTKHVIFQGLKDDIVNGPEYKHDVTDYGSYYDYWHGLRRGDTGYERQTEFKRYVVYPGELEEEEEEEEIRRGIT